MRVMIITPFFYPNTTGLSLSVKNQAIEISHLGHNVCLVLPAVKDDARRVVIDELKRANVDVRKVAFKNGKIGCMQFNLLTKESGGEIERIALEYGPDVLLVNEPVVLSLFCGIDIDSVKWRKGGVAVIGLVHAALELILEHSNKRIKAKYVARKALRVFNKYNCLVFPSKYLYDKYSVNTRKCVVRHLGVDKKVYNNISRTYDNVNKIIYVGRLDPEKNIRFLYDAAIAYCKRNQNVSWEFIGNGSLFSKYKKKETERIKFIGERNNNRLVNAYSSGDVFVFAGTIESFGLTVAEAMATGLPVIAPRSGGVAEQIEEGENGLLYESESQEDFFQKLDTVVSSAELRKKLGKSASLSVRSWQEGILSLFENKEIAKVLPNTNNKIHEILRQQPEVGVQLNEIQKMEYVEIAKELESYTKLIIQIMSIMLVLAGVGLKLVISEEMWVCPTMQAILLVMYFMHVKLMTDIIVNSAYMISIEDRINAQYNADVLAWQRIVGDIEIMNPISTKIKNTGIVFISWLYFAVYLPFVLLWDQPTVVSRLLYVLVSILIYAIMVKIITKYSNSSISRALFTIRLRTTKMQS